MTAIILAAGKGTRFGLYSKNHSKAFFEFNGQPNIEHTIELFEELGASNIFIAVGHEASEFNYLENKYKNVRLIYNALYIDSNSITSMAAVLNSDEFKVDDLTIVVDCDIYLTKRALLTKVDWSGYTCFKEKNPVEWQLYLDNDNLIKTVALNGVDDDSFPILDISYWKKEDLLKIRKYINEKLADNVFNIYWDEIPCFYYFKDFKLKANIIDNTDAEEYDTQEDANRIAKLFKKE